METLFDTSVPWYFHKPPQLQSEFRELMTNYTNIQPTGIEKHVQSVHDEAWRVVGQPPPKFSTSAETTNKGTPKAPLPCVGSYLFAELALFKHPAYPAILNRLKTDPSSIYLEVGCGLAQDIRKLIADGAPAASLRGTDLQDRLMTCGQDLFLDADALPLSDGSDAAQNGKSTFLAADFLDESDASPLKGWEGGVDIVHASMFLHCFELPDQVRACKRIVALLRRQPGSMLVGRSGGVSLGAGGAREEEVKGPLSQVARTHYLHDVDSFHEMWARVGRETGTRWEVKLVEEEIVDAGGRYFAGGDHRWLRFEVSRL